MSQYAERIAQKFVAGEESTNTRLWTGTFFPDHGYIGGVNTKKPDAPRALYSYGPHYPVAIVDQEGEGIWVNTTPYMVNEYDRSQAEYYNYGDNYRGAWLGRPARKQTPSPTTKDHCTQVERALRAAGFIPVQEERTVTTEGTDGEPLTHTMRLWVRD